MNATRIPSRIPEGYAYYELRGDEVWCVFGKDAFRVTKPEEIETALALIEAQRACGECSHA